MTKLFTVAGTSSKAGVSKFRVANGTAAQRTKLLIKDGQTDIQLFDLPKPMSKEDASAFVKSKGFNFELAAPAAPKVAKAPKQKTVKLSTIVKKVSKKFRLLLRPLRKFLLNSFLQKLVLSPTSASRTWTKLPASRPRTSRPCVVCPIVSLLCVTTTKNKWEVDSLPFCATINYQL